MSNFVVYNENGGIIVDDTFKHIGNVAQNVITTLPTLGGFPITLSFDSVAPSWFPVTTMDTQVLDLTPIEGAVPMSVLMPNSEAYGAGRGTFSTNAGTLYCLRNDYTLSSGYLDVFDASGNLIWSASSASKVPRVTQVVHFTYQELINGKEVFIGNNSGFMVDNILGSLDINPSPSGTSSRWFAMFWRYLNGYFKIQFLFKGNTTNIENVSIIKSLKTYGWKLYVFKYAG